MAPGKPIDKDLYELPPAEAKRVKQLPGLLDEVLDTLEKAHAFLLKGDVFTPDLIETWIEYKRKNEVDPIRLRPHPWEFASTSTSSSKVGARPRDTASRRMPGAVACSVPRDYFPAGVSFSASVWPPEPQRGVP